MLSVNNIEVVYNDVILVLKGISLGVPEGGVVALLGANGAGKSTTLKAISGILDSQNGELKEGSIEFMGRPIHKLDPDQIVKMGITMVPEGRKVFEDLTVMENLMIGAHTRSDRTFVKKDLEIIFDYFPVLAERKNQLAIFLSGGEQQMLVIGRALMSKPKLMMLDEPSLGLAPLLVKEIFGILRTINQEQKAALLLIEQNARIALNFSQYGYIMENGGWFKEPWLSVFLRRHPAKGLWQQKQAGRGEKDLTRKNLLSLDWNRIQDNFTKIYLSIDMK